MKKQKVMVTGGAGFIGSALVERLMQEGYSVIVYDNLSTGNTHALKSWEKSPNFNFIHADALDMDSLQEAVNESDIVFHLAANPDVRIGYNNSQIDFEQNLKATYFLLECMKNSPTCKRIIFASSSTVYGEPDSIPTAETYSPLAPISLYGAAKLGSEALISGYCHMFELSSVVVRLANIIGPCSNHGVIHDFVNKLNSNNAELNILGDGSQLKSYLFVDDCINAFLSLMNVNTTFDVFNVGSKDYIKVIDIAKITIEELGLKNVKITFSNNFNGRGWKGDVKTMLLDSTKLTGIGWNPNYRSEDAVRMTIRGIRERMAHTGESYDNKKLSKRYI